jgi:hypothetical protein
MFTAEAKLKRVRVLLSRKRETANPESKTRGDTPPLRSWRNASAAASTARNSASDFYQVRRKSFPKSDWYGCPARFSIAAVSCGVVMRTV